MVHGFDDWYNGKVYQREAGRVRTEKSTPKGTELSLWASVVEDMATSWSSQQVPILGRMLM